MSLKKVLNLLKKELNRVVLLKKVLKNGIYSKKEIYYKKSYTKKQLKKWNSQKKLRFFLADEALHYSTIYPNFRDLGSARKLGLWPTPHIGWPSTKPNPTVYSRLP